MSYQPPTILQFQQLFVRDFPYGSNINTSITDTDIANAYTLTNININPGLWATQANYTIGYLYLSAHYLVLNLRASSQGINGQFNWLEAGKGVGSVNSTFSIPQRVLDNPLWSMYTKTNYGMQYLQLLLPQLSGYMYPVAGGVNPFPGGIGCV